MVTGSESSAPSVTLDQGVSDRLGRDIVDGVRPAGSVMRLEDLEAEFGVSRTVVRDAVRELSSLGMLRSRRRVGLQVQPLSSWSVYHPKVIAWRIEARNPNAQLEAIAELRLGVEPIAARLAAQRRSNQTAARLMALGEVLEDSGRRIDHDVYLPADVEFHRLILESSDNDMFAALAVSVEAALTSRTREGLMPPSPRPHSFQLHVEVANAIERRDGGRAEYAMRDLVEEVMLEFRPST